jgi:hypothetical protein
MPSSTLYVLPTSVRLFLLVLAIGVIVAIARGVARADEREWRAKQGAEAATPSASHKRRA